MNGFELILPFLRPIEGLILDPDVSEIMVNGPNRIFVEKDGYVQAVPKITLTPMSDDMCTHTMSRSGEWR